MNPAYDHLAATGAYQDVDPVVLTSGKIGIYYINAENLLQDDGKFADYGDDHQGMIAHAMSVYNQGGPFAQVVDLLAEKVSHAFQEGPNAISGGQRRDWIFSGPVASLLEVPHIALYKNGHYEGNLDGMNVVHVVDLLTAASSCYRVEEGVEKGWIPWIRQAGGTVKDLFTVVTRLQGGEENLAAQGITVEALVKIDRDFLGVYSKSPERALEYQQDDEAWTRNYLEEHGALDLLSTFNPSHGKLERAWKFLDRYGAFLKSVNKWDELSEKVNKEFRFSIARG